MTLDVRALAIGVRGATSALAEDLSFAVEPGERYAIAGPSGCGKTTLLRTLAALEDPLAGEVTLDGRTAREHGYPEWRRQVVYVSQRPELLSPTVAEALARPFTYRTARTAFREDVAREALAAVGLADRWDAACATLSAGEAQRVALVRAALIEPRVLLLDEPTSALDGARTEAIEAWLAELGAAIVLVTHDAEQRKRYCGRDALVLGPR
ncbi:MAG: ATP-binding cassette domain-containing protein [Sandaracinaceae bacterium]